MNELIFNAYRRLLQIHIQSFTTGTQFHKDTEEAYEKAFDVFHKLSEFEQSMGENSSSDCELNGQEVYNLIELIKNEVESIIKSNNDIGYDNLLRGQMESLQLLCGKFKQYIKEEVKEKEEEENMTTIVKRGGLLNNL